MHLLFVPTDTDRQWSWQTSADWLDLFVRSFLSKLFETPFKPQKLVFLVICCQVDNGVNLFTFNANILFLRQEVKPVSLASLWKMQSWNPEVQSYEKLWSRNLMDRDCEKKRLNYVKTASPLKQLLLGANWQSRSQQYCRLVCNYFSKRTFVFMWNYWNY